MEEKRRKRCRNKINNNKQSDTKNNKKNKNKRIKKKKNRNQEEGRIMKREIYKFRRESVEYEEEAD